jgi:hypothetical protein
VKLYLFGPMRSIKNENREAFKEARETLRAMGHEVFCPSEFTQDTQIKNLRKAM